MISRMVFASSTRIGLFADCTIQHTNVASARRVCCNSSCSCVSVIFGSRLMARSSGGGIASRPTVIHDARVQRRIRPLVAVLAPVTQATITPKRLNSAVRLVLSPAHVPLPLVRSAVLRHLPLRPLPLKPIDFSRDRSGADGRNRDSQNQRAARPCQPARFRRCCASLLPECLPIPYI